MREQLLTLWEHRTSGPINLTHAQVEFLVGSGSGITARPAAGGRWQLRATSKVGTLVGAGLRVVIRPKLSIRRLMFLLTYGPDATRVGKPVLFAEDSELLEVMQDQYAAALGRALRGGLVRDYRRKQERLSILRGRVRVSELYGRHFGIVPPVPCEFEAYTMDTEVNRRLLAAANVLLRLVPGKRPSTTQLRRLASQFGEVPLLNYQPSRVGPLRLDRRHQHYGSAPDLATLILQHTSLAFDGPATRGVSFIVDMNDLYERFVVDALRDALGLNRRRWRHHPVGQYLDEARSLAVIPDAVWYGATGRAQLVLDAKYKASPAGTRADIHQMVAYCTALGVRDGVLVYAKSDGRRLDVRRADTRVHVVELDPDAVPGELHTRVDDLAHTLRAIVAAP